MNNLVESHGSTSPPRVAVFCSAAFNIDPRYESAARSVVAGLCDKGYSIVSGGTIKGTMAAVADEVAVRGGVHHGVLPSFMEEIVHPGLTTIQFTDSMSRRKELMRDGASAVVALPGGIGTLDELVETLVLRKLGQWEGLIVALDLDGFYGPLRALLNHYVEAGMLPPEDLSLISIPATPQELLSLF